VKSHSVAQRGAGAAAAGNEADAGAAETTEVVVEAASNKAVRGVSSEGAKKGYRISQRISRKSGRGRSRYVCRSS